MSNIKILNNNLYVIQNGHILNNTYIYIKNNYAIVIDPSFAEKEIENILIKHNIDQFDILITHYHYDHIGCTQKIAKQNTTIYIGENEYQYLNRQYSTNFNELVNDLLIANHIKKISGNIELNLNGINVKCLNTPSHTMGSYTYLIDKYAFTGDFIFAYQIGFFDMENDGLTKFKQSLELLNDNINNEYLICSGHNELEIWKNVKEKNIEMMNYYGGVLKNEN